MTVTATATEDSTKKYGVFTLSHKVNGGNAEGKTNLFISKLEVSALKTEWSLTQEDEMKKFFCKKHLSQQEQEKECKVYHFEDNKKPDANYKKIKMSDITESKKIKDLKENNFYVVDLKLTDNEIKEITSFPKITIFGQKDDNGNKYPLAYTNIVTTLSDEQDFDKDKRPIILS